MGRSEKGIGTWSRAFCGVAGTAAVALIALLVAPRHCFAQAEKDATAERCGVDFKKPAQRVFADPSGKGPWTEFRDVRSVPDLSLDDGGAVARLWPGSDGSLFIFVEEPAEDFNIGSEYCFDKTGALTQMRFQVKTAWGWGFREEGPVKDGGIAADTKEFFDTEKGGSIARPDEASDIAAALKPHVYRKIPDLPFGKLLEPPKTD